DAASVCGSVSCESEQAVSASAGQHFALSAPRHTATKYQRLIWQHSAPTCCAILVFFRVVRISKR
ncbi:unnamed protein product, partial [Ectocarpus sp. 4 AP-2014]